MINKNSIKINQNNNQTSHDGIERDLIVWNDGRDAFENLFKLHYSNLCSYAKILVKCPDVAKDIVQEKFILIWEKRRSIKVELSWKAYLYRSVHNECLNHLKKSCSLYQKQEKFYKEMVLHNNLILSNFDANSFDKLIEEDLEKKLKEALDDLPAECRKVFILSRYNQLSYKEIAKTLNISVNTVKTQMKRAIKKLHIAIDN
jgi:RNA polymerase sigma-70 factor, ECF subfamily